MKNTTYLAKGAVLRASVASAVLGLALISAPAFAQSADDEEAAKDEIVVTGSILRRTDLDTVSPVTTVTAESLDQRALNTVQESIQTLSANNGPALTNSFTANGAFGAGASAISLRGLSTSSTLVLFDGMRAAYYPLADDGARNFVDLNTIPDDIIDRVEVLRDGASSSYGADAIAGVVNIITKKQFQGFSARAEAGISQRGDAGNHRLTATAGFGDLDEDGFNAYVSGFKYHSAALYNRDRGYPYNTDDKRNICFEGHCGPNDVLNGLEADGTFDTAGFAQASPFVIRPYNAANTAAQGRYVQLTPGCNGLPSHNLTAAELASSALAPTTVCQEDITNLYGVINPEIDRYGISGRATYKLGDTTEAYLALNYMQTKVGYSGNLATIRANAPAGISFPRYSTSAATAAYGNTILTLPIWVCAARVNCATAADKKLNPNNPFAAAGQVGRILGRLPDIQEFNQTRNRAYRAAFGVKGDLFDGWNYTADFTAMQVKLRRTSEGYVYIQHLLDVIADGSYNFVNPSANTQAVRDYLAPVNITDSKSAQYQAQFIVSGTLAELPGGPLQLGLGGSVRRESVNAPSANDDYSGPTERYFRLNAFGTSGKRTVWSTFGELNAPIIDMVEINLSGRYDHYSSGQSSFSPKAGLKFKPIEQITLRGTWSKGFRIPSFAESNALPTTGFVTASAGIYTDSYLATYGCSKATFSTCPTYVRSTSYGLTSLGTAGLKPEKSTNITLGAVFEPVSNIALTVDYYNIKKTDAITTADTAVAINAYYSGQPIPAGYTVIPDAADINNPTLLPRIAFVQSGFVNANTMRSEGLDFSATGKFNVGPVKWTTTAEASYIMELSTTFPSGGKESYAGTIGNYNLTAGTGTPRWHGSWQNTFDAGAFSLTGTANYFGGYDLSAEDQGGVAGDCGLSSGYTPCRVKSYITVDLAASLEVNDKFTIYMNMLNAFDRMPPIDHVTYGAHLYNAVQGGTGIVGRAFRAGVKVKF